MKKDKIIEQYNKKQKALDTLKNKIEKILIKDGIRKYCLIFKTSNCTCYRSTGHSRSCETRKTDNDFLITRFTKLSNRNIYQDELDFRFINRDVIMYYNEFYKFEKEYEDIKRWM